MSGFELVGNLSEIDKLAASIAQLGQKKFQRQMFSDMGDAALDLVADEFAASHDPTGNAWEQLKHPRPAHIGAGPLVKTGALQASIRKRLTPEGFSLYTSKKYAAFHQNGTRHMVARPIFPVGQPPQEWLLKFDRIAEAHIRRLLPTAA